MPHRLCFVVFPDFQQLDLAGPLAAFEIAERYRPGSYDWRIASSTGGAVLSSARIPWATQALPRLDRCDSVVLAGGDGVDAAMADTRLRRWLQRAAAADRLRVASICSGSLLLAAAGLLDGRRATTHWSRTEQFRACFPAVQLDADRIHVRDGRTWTSAGICAGIDLALALVAHDLGESLARRVAQQLVVYFQRPGGQSQFSALAEMTPSSDRFAALLDHVRQHLDEPHRIEDLAARACMSPRHFARRFAAETGRTPAEAVEALRVEAARAALDSGAASLQTVARDCGFGNADRMRRSFVRRLGVTPALLKRSSPAAST